jgi:hypothetical protein
MDVKNRIAELRLEGLCCSQIVLQIAGIDAAGGAENPELIKCARGLCYGLQTQEACGALAGGILALSMYGLNKTELKETAADYTNRFEAEAGGVTCADLIGEGAPPVSAICSKAILTAAEKCLEILNERGFI